jgi:hypothetical protein
MSFFDTALSSLGINGLCYTGSIRTESDFLNNSYKVTGGVDANGEGILSRNPDDFGVTWEQIEDQIAIEEQKFSDTQYQRDRQAEYPSLLELTVALYDTDDKAAVEAKRAAVKAKYPKPE